MLEKLPPLLDREGWTELFGSATTTLDHLELRDSYAVDTESPAYQHWRENQDKPRPPRESYWQSLVTDTVGRGVVIRRLRVVSLPPTDYIRFEHAGTWQTVEAGEDVRWLPREDAAGLFVPSNDFWLTDRERIMFNLFDGDGRPNGRFLTENIDLAKAISEAFDALWALATPHEEFVL
ncbi:hypothetical protein BZB76_5414 [Actinomadura pelletieri DSM 43383]|uniref:DUF6879 domain-containing protein n=1 Tax=Actinomadura pelletieri DSM 43383 TaxID=1120940 RepID=A0A495QGD8_9ACTN|nr:DUF6879 family protein [Actinomadura pelletieri]RKS70934.1 hypothetical protein BZB76_5414 [Actinomadura pelletieri DSM 43383]